MGHSQAETVAEGRTCSDRMKCARRIFSVCKKGLLGRSLGD